MANRTQPSRKVSRQGDWSQQFQPADALRRRTRMKRRSAFLTCLMAAALLVALCLTGTLIHYLSQPTRFEQALLKYVDYQSLGTDESSVRSFATETIRYIAGQQPSWEPQITIAGLPASLFIPQSFRTHMAEVRDWVATAKVAVVAGALLALTLLGRAVFGGGRRSFSVGGYYLGTCLPLALIVGLGAWAYVDFGGMWAWLHRVFIPDGIFSAAEPIMQLFPLELFADYLAPCAITFGVATAIVLLLPLPLSRLSSQVARKRSR